jgi:hypothetical protein
LRGRAGMIRLRLMSLNANEKDALAFQLVELLSHDEPHAFITCLHRIADRQASRAARMSDHETAIRWQDIADSLDAALTRVTVT